MPDPTTQRHHAPDPIALGIAGEEVHACISHQAPAMPLPWGEGGNWLAKRKAAMPPQRTTAGLRESSIPKKM